MFRRRSFLIGCGGLAAVPALAGTGAPVADADVAVPTMLAQQANPVEGDALALRIAGWDMAAPQHADDEGVWVHVGSSWQVAWR